MTRILTVLIALSWMIAHGAADQSSILVATCELEGLRGSETSAPSDEDWQALRQIATNLKPTDAEVIVAHGLPDRQMAKRLAVLLKPGSYHVAFHGSFNKSGPNSPTVGPPITVFTRKQPFASRAVEWRTTGRIDWPGGFAFVGLHSGTNTLCVYVTHLPGEPALRADNENPLMARRRDLAAQYLVHHANWIANTLSNQLVTALITGDFITDPRGSRDEGAIRILRQAGFRMALPASGASKAGGTDEEPASSLLTALLARNADLISTALLADRKGSGLEIATYEVAPAPTAGGSPFPYSPPSLAAARPVAAKVVTLDSSLVWLWVGGITALSLAILFSVWFLRRTFSAAGILGRRSNNAVVLDLGPYHHTPNEPFAFPPERGESYSTSTAEAGGTQAALWQTRAIQAEQRARQMAGLFTNGLRPQLSRLLRDRLIAWLHFQRHALLTSHEAGTNQVLQLETRLQEIQGQFQGRLRNREERIAELERDLRVKEKMIRDLLRAQGRLADEETR
jgi:hypothetical protein